LELPVANDFPGTDRPTVAVAVDLNGRFYFQNQLIAERELRTRLQIAATNSPTPLTLVVQADKRASYEMLIELTILAREAGIRHVLLATLPVAFAPAAASAPKP
jgi:biopolymer transport protein ExbD